jgi:hypothetical protein
MPTRRIRREKADLGVFLCFEEPTRPMLKEAAEAGFYKSSDGTTYPRLQILTIQQILDGRQPQYPLHRRDATFKKAPRSRPAAAENLTLPLLPREECRRLRCSLCGLSKKIPHSTHPALH